MKKKYIKPETVIIKCSYEGGLLAGSGPDYETPDDKDKVNPGSDPKPIVTTAKPHRSLWSDWDTDEGLGGW